MLGLGGESSWLVSMCRQNYISSVLSVFVLQSKYLVDHRLHKTLLKTTDFSTLYRVKIKHLNKKENMIDRLINQITTNNTFQDEN